MLAVDPTSRRSGGSLLGDRARIDFDPGDRGVFIRSTAAAERLGGLAAATRAAAGALAAAFDVVVIETVGVGQAETEVAEVADTVAVVVQPGSGDVLQFLKSGIMEIPDVLVVTKADLGQVAHARAPRPGRGAALARPRTRVLAVSSLPPAQGIDELVDALDEHRAALDLPAPAPRARRSGALDRLHARARRARPARARRTPAAEHWLAEQDAGLEVAALVAALERRRPEPLSAPRRAARSLPPSAPRTRPRRLRRPDCRALRGSLATRRSTAANAARSSGRSSHGSGGGRSRWPEQRLDHARAAATAAAR